MPGIRRRLLDPKQRRCSKIARGEVGILRYIHCGDRPSAKCFVIFQHEEEHFVGTLVFDNTKICHEIVSVLQNHIKELGDIEVP